MRGMVHDLTLRRVFSADPDASGRGGEKTTRTRFRGRLDMLSAKERADAATYAEDVAAVAHAPLDLPIADPDRIEAAGIHPQLDGTYEVAAIDYRVKYQRILLRRSAV